MPALTDSIRPDGASLACALGGLLVLWPAAAGADDYHTQDFPVGNRAMVLGGAFSALADDPSGVLYNPAGLVDASRANISVSASMYGLDHTAVEGTGAANTGFRIIPGEVGGLFTFDWDRRTKRSPISLGFTVVSPTVGERLIVSAEDRSGRRGHLRVSDTSRTVRDTSDKLLWVGAGTGVSLTEALSVGASAFLLHRTVALTTQSTWVRQETDAFAAWNAERSDGEYVPASEFYNAVASLDESDQSLVGMAGVKLRRGRLLLGANVRLPGVPVRSKGSVSHAVFSARADAPVVAETTTQEGDPSLGVQARTRWPAGIRAGAAFVQPQQFTAACDVAADLPSRSRRWFFDDPVAEAAFRLPRHVARRLVVNGACGFERLLRDGLSLAVGVHTDLSAVADRLDGRQTATDFDGHIEDIDRYGTTVSLGYFGEHSLTRVGIASALGVGHAATYGVWDNTWRVHEVRRTSAYLFIASTFRY